MNGLNGVNGFDPDLTAAYLPCLLRVLEVVDNGGEKVESAAALRAGVFEMMNAATESISMTTTPQITSLARRMVEAWCDERLGTAPWRWREDWQAHPLQSDWGEGRRAGEWIFDKIAGLDPSRSGDAEVAALALRCLALGLRGRLDRTPSELTALRKDTANRFGLSGGQAPFPAEVVVGSGREAKRSRAFMKTALCLLVAGAVLFTGWRLADRRLEMLAAERLETIR